MDSPEKLHLYIVLNPIAGHSRSDELHELIQKECQQAGVSYEIYETTGREDIAEVTSQACKRTPEIIVAAGGDGTVSGVVQGLVEKDIPLGVIPVGTGNALARAMGIPLEPAAALALLLGEHTRRKLDAMQVGEKYFLLNVSAGISSRAMINTPPEVKRRFGVLAYVWTILGEWIGFNSPRFLLTVDDHQVTIRASEVFVSNGAALREPPFPLGPAELFNDGIFDIYVLTAHSLMGYLKGIWRLIIDPKGRNPELRHLTAREKVVIEGLRRQQPVQADGEVLGETPVEVCMVPNALEILVPTEK